MKPTLYEALGLSRTAAEAEIKAALRRLVRRYYTKTRAGHTDVEEALRFLNHASHILGNPSRRAEYDATLAQSVRSASAMTTIGGPFDAELLRASGLGDSISHLGLPRDRLPPPPELAPAWSAKLADVRRTPAGQLAALIGMIVVFIVAWLLVVPRDGAPQVIGFTLAMSLSLVAFAGAVYGVVHLLSRSVWKLPAPETALTLVEGMIPRWRKDRTVFLGTGAPVEDATWLFRLRMAELKRVKAERVSDPQPVMRFFARLFDYATWALVFAVLLALLVSTGAVNVSARDFALHPLIAPIVITGTWIPIEAMLLAQLQTTPGRWLLCVYLQQGVSNPYAPEELRFTFRAAGARALDVWWRGCTAWMPFVSLVTVARAYECVKRTGETRWDSERDCLITHGPVGHLSLFTLVFGLAASALVFGSQWRAPVNLMTSGIGATWTSAFARLEPPSASLPAPTGPLSRITRIDDTSAATQAPTPAEADPMTTSPATSTTPGGMSVNVPPLSPSVASNRAIAVENLQPAEVNRVGDAPALTPRVTSSTVAAPPAADSRQRLSASPSQAELMPSPQSAPPEQTTPAASTSAAALSTAKTLIANLWRKPQPPAEEPLPAAVEPSGPSPLELRERRVAEFARQAQRQQSAGDYSGLIRTCKRWADDDWKNPRAYYCLGIGLQGTGQHKQAITMFNKAGSLLPRNDPLKTQIGDAVVRSFRAQTGG